MIQVDTRTGQYVCGGCGQEFNTQGEMYEHQMNCPATVQVTTGYTCSRCDMTFDTEADLLDHEHSHEGMYL